MGGEGRTEGPAEAVPSPPWDGHELLVTTTEEEPAGLAAWTERGLRRSEKLIVAGDARYPRTEALVEVLVGAGVEGAGRAVERGQLSVVDAARFYAGYEALVDEALRDGHPGVRSYNGPATAVGVLDDAQFEQFEHQLERVWRTRGVAALCRYEPELLRTSEDLRSAIRRHPSGVIEPMVRAHSAGPGRLRLAGEVDVANHHLLAELLAAAVRRAGAELVLDCEELTFMSVGAWRSVVTTTEDYRAGGGRVRLASLPTIAATLLHLTSYAEAFEMDRGHER